MSKKEKKIGFQLYLEKKASPRNKDFYPVYLRVTFKRQSTKLKHIFFDDYIQYWREEDLANWEKGAFKKIYKPELLAMQQSLDFFENIIRYEEAKNSENYSIIGIASRARMYRVQIDELLKEQIEMLAAIEIPLLNDSSGFSAKVKNPLDTEAIIEQAKAISPALRTMIELHCLLYLYASDLFNTKINSDFVNTIYHFVVNPGVKDFKIFTENYFSKNADALNFSALEHISASENVFHNEFTALSRAFPPKKDKAQTYLNLLNVFILRTMKKM